MATIRGTGMQASSASSYVVPWPAGTVAGDLAVVMVGHGYGPSAPSGWNVHDSQSGSNWSGAVYSRILTAADITAGSVTVSFGGGYDGCAAIITFVGSSGFAVQSATGVRNGSGAASVPVTANITGAGNPLVYFGSNRAASTDTVDRGTQQRQVNDGANASGCLYTEPNLSGAITANFLYSPAGIGNYQAIIAVGTPPVPAAPAIAGPMTDTNALSKHQPVKAASIGGGVGGGAYTFLW